MIQENAKRLDVKKNEEVGVGEPSSQLERNVHKRAERKRKETTIANATHIRGIERMAISIHRLYRSPLSIRTRHNNRIPSTPHSRSPPRSRIMGFPTNHHNGQSRILPAQRSISSIPRRMLTRRRRCRWVYNMLWLFRVVAIVVDMIMFPITLRWRLQLMLDPRRIKPRGRQPFSIKRSR